MAWLLQNVIVIGLWAASSSHPHRPLLVNRHAMVQAHLVIDWPDAPPPLVRSKHEWFLTLDAMTGDYAQETAMDLHWSMDGRPRALASTTFLLDADVTAVVAVWHQYSDQRRLLDRQVVVVRRDRPAVVHLQAVMMAKQPQGSWWSVVWAMVGTVMVALVSLLVLGVVQRLQMIEPVHEALSPDRLNEWLHSEEEEDASVDEEEDYSDESSYAPLPQQHWDLEPPYHAPSGREPSLTVQAPSTEEHSWSAASSLPLPPLMQRRLVGPDLPFEAALEQSVQVHDGPPEFVTVIRRPQSTLFAAPPTTAPSLLPPMAPTTSRKRALTIDHPRQVRRRSSLAAIDDLFEQPPVRRRRSLSSTIPESALKLSEEGGPQEPAVALPVATASDPTSRPTVPPSSRLGLAQSVDDGPDHTPMDGPAARRQPVVTVSSPRAPPPRPASDEHPLLNDTVEPRRLEFVQRAEAARCQDQNGVQITTAKVDGADEEAPVEAVGDETVVVEETGNGKGVPEDPLPVSADEEATQLGRHDLVTVRDVAAVLSNLAPTLEEPVTVGLPQGSAGQTTMSLKGVADTQLHDEAADALVDVPSTQGGLAGDDTGVLGGDSDEEVSVLSERQVKAELKSSVAVHESVQDDALSDPVVDKALPSPSVAALPSPPVAALASVESVGRDACDHEGEKTTPCGSPAGSPRQIQASSEISYVSTLPPHSNASDDRPDLGRFRPSDATVLREGAASLFGHVILPEQPEGVRAGDTIDEAEQLVADDPPVPAKAGLVEHSAVAAHDDDNDSVQLLDSLGRFVKMRHQPFLDVLPDIVPSNQLQAAMKALEEPEWTLSEDFEDQAPKKSSKKDCRRRRQSSKDKRKTTKTPADAKSSRSSKDGRKSSKCSTTKVKTEDRSKSRSVGNVEQKASSRRRVEKATGVSCGNPKKDPPRLVSVADSSQSGLDEAKLVEAAAKAARQAKRGKAKVDEPVPVKPAVDAVDSVAKSRTSLKKTKMDGAKSKESQQGALFTPCPFASQPSPARVVSFSGTTAPDAAHDKQPSKEEQVVKDATTRSPNVHQAAAAAAAAASAVAKRTRRDNNDSEVREWMPDRPSRARANEDSMEYDKRGKRSLDVHDSVLDLWGPAPAKRSKVYGRHF